MRGADENPPRTAPGGQVLAAPALPQQPLIACPECDLLHQASSIREHSVGAWPQRCVRCGALLSRPRPQGVERALALTLAGCLLFSAALLLPFLRFRMGPQTNETTLLQGVQQLFDQGRPLVALVVLITCVIAPTLRLGGMVYVLAPIQLGRRAPAQQRIYRWVRRFRSWTMIEVFLLALLVAAAKLVGWGSIRVGLGLWAFVGLVPLLVAVESSVEPSDIWRGGAGR